ncbi:MAG TPA: hypothetical protein HA362_00610 [Nanoarchaeota archaeon]|nr:hypothetical protein [Nanoarchaeota archaeon]
MKGILLLSSGIDSPVAGYLMLKRGVEIVALHMDNQPLVNALPKEKTIKLAKKLAELSGREIKIYIVNHGRNQVEMIRNTERKYQCILCRRMMLRIAEKIAEKENADFIVTGENLAQVASQTLKNMANEESAVQMPVLRPLLCYDKVDTIKIAREIGTYEISIEAGMCCAAVPKNPATQSKKESVAREEAKLDVDAMTENAIKEAEIIAVG